MRLAGRRGAVRSLAAVLAVLAVTAPLTGLVAAGAAPATPADDADVDAGIVTEGNVATIDVGLPEDVDSATLSVGEREHNFLANATVHDRDGDGSVTVRLDTAEAGNGNAGTYLSATGGDELTDATQVTGPTDDGLDPLPYSVDLVRSGDVLAGGTLFVDADETDGDESATGSFHYEGERVTLTAADGQTVRGETSLAPGSDATVVLEAVHDHSIAGARWDKSFGDPTIAENGTFVATVDLAGLGPNVTFQARLVHDETVVTTARGRLAPCEQHCLGTDEVNVLGGVAVDQNRTAEIPVTFGSGDRLNVTVTNADGPAYRLNATVRDTDGDDRATLLVRTESAGEDEPTLFVREGGETRPAEITGETTLDRTLPAALYRVEARTPGERNAWDVGTLVVFESARPPATPTATPGAPSSSGDGSASDAGNDANSGATGATDTPETPDPLEVQTDDGSDGPALLPLGSVGAGGLIAIGGLLRLLRG